MQKVKKQDYPEKKWTGILWKQLIQFGKGSKRPQAKGPNPKPVDG
jgi:hypothetical protein